MKKLRFLAFVIAMVLISSVILSSCQKQNGNDILSHIGSSEITSSDTATSEPEKDVSSPKPEESSKSEEISKPKPAVSSEPKSEASSKPKPAVSSAPNKPTSKPTRDPLEYMQPHELFKGKWTANVDIVPQLVKEGYVLQGSAFVKATYEFPGNGTGTYTIDKTSFLNAMKSVLEQTLQAELTAKNLTKQEFEAQIEMTCEEYIDSVINSMAGYATSYTFYCMFDDECLNIQTGENSYDGYPYEFKTADKVVINESGQFVTYTRIK